MRSQKNLGARKGDRDWGDEGTKCDISIQCHTLSHDEVKDGGVEGGKLQYSEVFSKS